MFGFLTRGWSWLVDGANEALGSLLDRVTARATVRVAVGDDGATVRARDGAVVARLLEADGTLRLEPPSAVKQLTGAPVEVWIPSGWLFRRKLEPVAAQGAPFLTAFVQHQIERVTPWRVADVFFCVRQAPLPGDASRLAVEIAAVPRHLASALLGTLQTCRPARLSLVTLSAQDGQRFDIPIDDRGALRATSRRPLVAVAVAALLLVWPAALGVAAWSTAQVQDEIDEADRVIDERKSVLAAAARHDRAATEGDKALGELRRTRIRAVDLIEALSAALPDTAYVTDLSIDKDHVRLSGVSTDTPRLVPALETSGRFTDATFFDAITRVENGTGDRFHIEMRPRVAGAPGAAP